MGRCIRRQVPSLEVAEVAQFLRGAVRRLFKAQAPYFALILSAVTGLFAFYHLPQPMLVFLILASAIVVSVFLGIGTLQFSIDSIRHIMHQATLSYDHVHRQVSQLLFTLYALTSGLALLGISGWILVLHELYQRGIITPLIHMKPIGILVRPIEGVYLDIAMLLMVYCFGVILYALIYRSNAAGIMSTIETVEDSVGVLEYDLDNCDMRNPAFMGKILGSHYHQISGYLLQWFATITLISGVSFLFSAYYVYLKNHLWNTACVVFPLLVLCIGLILNLPQLWIRRA